MALTQKKFDDLEQDINDTGRFVNAKEVIAPRYGDPFKSAPLIAQELAENGLFQPFKTEVELKANVPLIVPTVAKALDTKRVWIYEQTSAEGIEPKAFAWNDTGLSELDLSLEEINRRTGVASYTNIIPIIADKNGKVPLWLNGGTLGFTALEEKTKTTVQKQIGIGEVISPKFIPVVVDQNNNCPLWLQAGLLNFAGIHDNAVALIKAKLGNIEASKKNNVTNAAYPIFSDGASLRQWKAKAAKLKSGATQQLRMITTGDSWTELNQINNEILTIFRNEFGESGTGWINVGFENNQLDGVSVSKSAGWSAEDLNDVSSFQNGCASDGFTLTSSTANSTINVSNVSKADTLTIFFGKTTGSFKYAINGGTETTVNVNATGAAIQSITINVSGITNLVLTVVSGTVAIFGFHARKSGSGFELSKMGNGYCTGQDYLKISPSSQANIVDYLKPDVVVIILGTNDYWRGHSVENYKLGILAMIDGYRTNNSNCGIILIAPGRSGGTIAIDQYKFRDAVYEIAQAKQAEFYNMHDDWDLWSVENANQQWLDILHVNKNGAYRIARKLFKSFMEI